MSRAILTIDDAPTKLTPRIINYLRSKDISPVINFVGASVERHFDEAVYAVKSGAVIGNHSFTHPHFSSLTLQECRNEILQTEQEIERVYKAAGMKRVHRIFRFPYGDKGGSHSTLLQQMLREEFQFERLDDSEINFLWWKENHLNTDIDMLWTFDFAEYQLSWNNGFTWDNIVKHVHNEHPEMGGYLHGKDTMNILLMHDTEETDKCLEKYYEKIIDYILSCDVEFVEPQFEKANRIKNYNF